MATYYNTQVTPQGSPEEAANRQLMTQVGQLISNPSKRDIPGNLMPDFLSGKLSFEDLQSQIGGSPTIDPTKGPQINYGQGPQALSGAQAGALAQGKSISEVSGMIPQNVAANQNIAAQNLATQNQARAEQYKQAFQATQGKAAPKDAATGIAAASALVPPAAQNQVENLQQQAQQNTTPAVDTFFQTNPVVQQGNQEFQNLINPTNVQADIFDQMQRIMGEQRGLGSLKAEYMNIQNIMGGTEQDIRDETQKAGGFATDSQVQALSIARNKVLMKQAALIQNQMQLQQDAIANDTSLLNFEKDMANTQFTQRMQIAQFAYKVQQDSVNAARDSAQAVAKNAGYSALLSQNPVDNARMEQILGLPKGGLQQLALIDQKKQAQQATMESLKLREQAAQTQIAEGKAAETTPQGIQAAQQAKTVQQLSNIENQDQIVNSLLNDPALQNAVGPNVFSRLGYVTAGMANFIGQVEQLRSKLTLDALINAKAQGATFGALSEGELNILKSSASKLNSWEQKDSTGKVIGYAAKESDFKSELDRINNMAKQDYLLKGGDPSLIGLHQTPDGQVYAENWDGSFTKFRTK